MRNQFDGGPQVRHPQHDRHPHGPHRHGGFPPGGFGPGGFGGEGFGAGFGRAFGRPGRGPRGRRTSRGDVRAAVLALVAEQPRHGYEIIQEIGTRTDGRWTPSPGSIYPTVAQLEDEGLVDTEKVEGRRMVQLTEAGRAYAGEHREELDAVWARAGEDEDEDAGELRQELGQLMNAVAQVAKVGNPQQAKTVVALITEARKGIYRLLAE